MLKKYLRDYFLRVKRRIAMGHVDDVLNGYVSGWAWYPKYPNCRPIIDIYVDDIFVGQTRAFIRREDLVSNGVGDGCYGFKFFIGKNIELCQLVCFVADVRRIELVNSKRKKSLSSDLVHDVYEYLHLTFNNKLSRVYKNYESQFFNIDKKIRAEPPLFEKLFDAPEILTNPIIYGRSQSAYLDYQLYKWDLQKRFSPCSTIEDHEKFLKDYIENYGRARFPDRVPLPRNEIEFLLEGPSLINPYRPSRAQVLFEGMFSSFSNENSEDVKILNAYNWAAYQSQLLHVEDCLISPELCGALSSYDDDGATFPLSLFMKIFISENRIFSRIEINNEKGRMLCYFIILLFAMDSPHLCQFIPQKWLRKFLNDDKSRQSLFDAHAVSIFPKTEFNFVCLRNYLKSKNYNILNTKFSTVANSGNRLEATALSASEVEEVDVQIIAPFSKELGISKSALVIAEAINSLPFTVRLCDYTKDYPNVSRSSINVELRHLGPARINIIHLNLEETPSLVAYSPDIFTGSRVILFPFIELPKLNRAQYLGLSLVDEIWCASEFIRNILSPYKETHLVGVGLPSYSCLGKYEARKAAYYSLVDENDFIFLVSADALSGVYRKNLLGVIRAFVHAFPNILNVKLVLKVHSLGRVVSDNEARIWRNIRDITLRDPRIILVDRTVSDDEQLAFIEGADCIVSLHRSEGLGYHILEAMQLMTPVIATAYSGNLDFCNEETSLLIPASIVNVGCGEYPRATSDQTWADPSFDASVSAMKKMFHDGDLRRELARKALSFYQENFTLTQFSKRIGQRIEHILSGDL